MSKVGIINLDLGVEKVITPVRRSLRFHDNYEYVPSIGSPAISKENQNGDSKKSEVLNLLQEHEYAYVPNAVFCLLHRIWILNYH
jgi:hypothetical protein